MRLSEKTLELNICAQVAGYVFWPHAFPGHHLIWFGLTQRQEAEAGYDAWTRVGGRLLLLQFKASKRRIGPSRRFTLDHDQLRNLRNRVRQHRRSVFYVFPLVGTSRELAGNPDLIPQTWLLDVAGLTNIPAPTKANGQPRRSGLHYADVTPGRVVLHSDPREFTTDRIDKVVPGPSPDAGWSKSSLPSFDAFWDLRRLLLRQSVALIIP